MVTLGQRTANSQISEYGGSSFSNHKSEHQFSTYVLELRRNLCPLDFKNGQDILLSPQFNKSSV